LIEQAEALGEAPEDPLLLFSVLHGFWHASMIDVNGNLLRELATHFLGLAERRGATVPLMIGHRLMGTSMTITGDIAEGRVHFDRAIALYDPAAHRPLASQFPQDVGVAILSWRHVALWLLGYPDAALADIERALNDARAIEQAATALYTQAWVAFTLIHCGKYPEANAQLDQVIALAEKKGPLLDPSGNDLPGLSVSSDRESLRCDPNAYLFIKRIAGIEDYIYASIAAFISGQGLRGHWSFRGRSAFYYRRNDGNRDDWRKMVRG
jgi:tetratricopeptide (TPR) repeat protein